MNTLGSHCKTGPWWYQAFYLEESELFYLAYYTISIILRIFMIKKWRTMRIQIFTKKLSTYSNWTENCFIPWTLYRECGLSKNNIQCGLRPHTIIIEVEFALFSEY